MKGLSQIGLGTAAIGRPHYINIRQEANLFQSLEEFKKQGYDLLNNVRFL